MKSFNNEDETDTLTLCKMIDCMKFSTESIKSAPWMNENLIEKKRPNDKSSTEQWQEHNVQRKISILFLLFSSCDFFPFLLVILFALLKIEKWTLFPPKQFPMKRRKFALFRTISLCSTDLVNFSQLDKKCYRKLKIILLYIKHFSV